MEKKQQIPGLNAESRTRGMLKGFDENSIQEFDFKIWRKKFTKNLVFRKNLNFLFFSSSEIVSP